MKLTLLIVLICFIDVRATLKAQNVSLEVEEMEIKDVFEMLKKQTQLEFFYSHQELNVNEKVSLKVKNTDLKEVLKDILGNRYRFEILDEMVVIKPAPRTQTKTPITITGSVKDTNGLPLPGVTIILKGTTLGVATDTQGKFSLTLPESDSQHVLVFSFIGMETKEIIYNNETTLDIVLEDELTTMDQVIVTGLFDKTKNSFAGSSSSYSREEIKTISNTNLIGALSMLTPGLKLVENNQMGSNPNALPEIVIRGNSSLATDDQLNPNQPLIILDGIQISLRDLYDIDINEIERVDVLKDASATALYGERAANGVIVIMRNRIASGPPRLSYNLDGNIEVPDLKSYNYLNAADKLEFERLAELYDFSRADDFEEYNRKKLLVSRGVDVDWMSKPLRTGVTLGNAIGISGRANDISYRVNVNAKNITGVMKKDYRNSYGLSIFLSYHLENKITVSLQNSYSTTSSKNSPYGTFSDYVSMNPYDMPKGEDGLYIGRLSWDIANPLYEAMCGNFSKSSTSTYKNNLNIRWDILQGLYVTATGSIGKTNSESKDFTSPESTTFDDEEIKLENKGKLIESYTKTLNYTGNFVMSYNKLFDENYLLSIHVGGDIEKNDSETSSYTTTGFYKSRLHKTGFAAIYEENGTPNGSQSLSTRLGIYGNANFMAFNRYFVDASIRRSGSSQFGSNKRYAPFWAIGGGWNIHNESFLNKTWVDILRLRYSYGVTGNVEFAPYQAVTTYTYNSNLYYLHGMGAIPKQMGNDDLTWQSTKMHNFGMNADLFNSRFSMTLDYYIKTTDDLLIDLTIPPSVGESTVKKNLGKIRNKGLEFDISAIIVKYEDFRFNLKLNGSHNTNKILKISNGLDAKNNEWNQDPEVAPRTQYKEGESTTAIYAVRSAGINPATGEEIFIKLNGEYTTKYDVNDKVSMGDKNPKLEGSILPSFYYKNWSLHIGMSYRFGGQIYNETRAANVENVNPKYNVDKRAYTQRWKQINDIVPYLDIKDTENRLHTVHTSRFVEDDDALEVKSIELAYEFNQDWIKRAGFKRLRLSVGTSNPLRWSTVKYERGTAYPFSRGFSFSISPTF